MLKRHNSQNEGYAKAFGRIIGIVIGILMSSVLAYGDQLPPETLGQLRSATIFLKVKTGAFESQGSGILLRKTGQIGYVATNLHVVQSEAGYSGTTSAVIYSGTTQEKTIPAMVVATDEEHDLAILKIQSVVLPEPLSKISTLPLSETMPIHILGFPFGEELSTHKQGLALTIGSGTISSIRSTDAGRIIQIDGDLNPGNSGGPVVDSQGALIGIAVAKVVGTEIGFVIPFEQIQQLFGGRIGAASLEKVQQGKYKVRADLADPFHKIQSVDILVAPAALVKSVKKDTEGNWPLISASASAFNLALQGTAVVGDFTLQKIGDKTYSIWYYQTRTKSTEGKTTYGQPQTLNADSSTGGTLAKTPSPAAGGSKAGWLGSSPSLGGASAQQGLHPVDVHKPLSGTKKIVQNATFTIVNFGDKRLLPYLEWTDEDSFVAADTLGTIHKVRVSTLQEEKQIDLQAQIQWMGISFEGILVFLPRYEQLDILDPNTLTIKKTVHIGSVQRVASCPSLSIAYVGGDRKLGIVDLVRGIVVREFAIQDMQVESYNPSTGYSEKITPRSFGKLLLTPDGKYLYSVGYLSTERYRISGRDLTLEESIHAQAAVGPATVSSDGLYIALPSVGIKTSNAALNAGALVFGSNNLQKTILSLPAVRDPGPVGFDPSSGKLYFSDATRPLMIYNAQGMMEKDYLLDNKPVRRVMLSLVHPKGNKLLMLEDDQLYWVEIH
jgi:S1-C subfamily serine protease